VTAAQWFELTIALLAAAGAIVAFVDMGRGLSFTLAKRPPPPAAPGLLSDRRRLDAVVQISDFRRLR
jgi:hypothetical protein